MLYSLQYPNTEMNAPITLTIQGRLTHRDYSVFLDLTEKVLSSGQKKFVLDMDGLDFIDSGGVGMLLMAFNLARESRVDLSILNARGQAMNVLQRTQLNELVALV